MSKQPADRYVLMDMLNATARAHGWVPFSADTHPERVTLTWTVPEPEPVNPLDLPEIGDDPITSAGHE